MKRKIVLSIVTGIVVYTTALAATFVYIIYYVA